MRALWNLLRSARDFRLLALAGLISLAGDWMVGIGLAYFVYELTGSTLASAGALLAGFLPNILLSSVAGVFVDRWNRKTTMVVANLAMAVTLTPLLLVDRPEHVWIVYVVTAIEGTIKLFSIPAAQAMLPELVDDADLVTANALNGQTREISRLVGSALGGIVIATGGVTALALIDAATFLLAALLILQIRASGWAKQDLVEEGVPDTSDAVPELSTPDPAEAARDASRLRVFAHEWMQGLRLAASDPVLRVVFLFSLIAMTGEGIMGTLFAPFVRDVLEGSSREYGFVAAVQAIGGLAGGVVAANLGRRLAPAAMFGYGAVLYGLIDLTMFLYPLAYVAIWPAMVCMVSFGIPAAVAMAGYNTLLQRNAADSIRGRVLGALGVVQGVGIVTGTLVGGLLGEIVGILPIIALQGLGGIAGGIVVLTMLRTRLHDRPAEQPALERS